MFTNLFRRYEWIEVHNNDALGGISVVNRQTGKTLAVNGQSIIGQVMREMGVSPEKKETIMGFGDAIRALKNSKKVARAGWNGKDMWLYLVPANSYPAQTEAAKKYWSEKNVPQSEHPPYYPMVPYGAYIAMKTAQENVVPWLASQTDMLAEDWEIVE